MKYKDLIRKIRDASGGAELDFDMKRQKGSHQMWICGSTSVTIPKHNEVNELTAESICKTLEAELGENWWR